MNIISCIISFLYIKPQPFQEIEDKGNCCIISFLYIKPQLVDRTSRQHASCIISFLYIKPQRSATKINARCVVLYRFSTSNHNNKVILLGNVGLYYIVSLHQTTTRINAYSTDFLLYYIVSLHQTTTRIIGGRLTSELYYIVSLHQTTTEKEYYKKVFELYYIVSLHQTTTTLQMWHQRMVVVLYRFSTSNHNNGCAHSSA